MPVKSSPKTGKLRRTCEAVCSPVLLYLCASVKVKCSKEKPECSRCQHRGITCQYFVEKRPGRKRQLSRHTDEANSDVAATGCCCGQVGNDIRQPSRSSLSPYSFSPYTLSTMPDERDSERITDSVTFASGHSHTLTNMITNCDGCFEFAHISQNFICNTPFSNGVAAVDHSSIFPEFEGGCGSMLVDARSEMDRLGFFRPPTVPALYQPPPPSRDNTSLSMHIEDKTGFTPISESISILNTSSCSCCSSTGRPESSSARFSSTGPSTASIVSMSTGGTSPANIPQALTCQCLDQALQLLKTVSGSSRMSSSSSSSSASSSVHSHYSNDDESSTDFCETETEPQWLQAILSENRQCLGAMDNILACSSTAEDSMLPIFLCMILLKILDRYSNVAFSQSLLSHSHSHGIAELGSNMSGYLIVETGLVASTIHRHTLVSNEQGQMQHIHLDRGISQHSDSEHFGRAISHLILGELHWMQRVVNKLVARLKRSDRYNASRPTQQSCGWESRQQITPSPLEEHVDLDLASSFSARTLGHMATDIQKRLTTLSSSIINQLRQS
ncbi:hypothetical protein J3E69DRAFT_352325 [Trichoderma sp. SZMC 28015]